MIQTVQISLGEWMTRGGDARIALDPETGLNRYFSAPHPREVLAFASSTANDLSSEAQDFLRERFPSGASFLEAGEAYDACLDGLRHEIRAAYGLGPDTDIFFAPSGTDLEYVGLLCVAGRRRGGIVNHLLGADEVGSGCIHSAAGEYFANETALGVDVSPRQPIAGLPSIDLADFPVRCDEGNAYPGARLARAMKRSILWSLERDRFPLVHVVHGSKTGLVLPDLGDIDRLTTRFGKDVAFVVDACQARITNAAIGEYLARGMIVFVTGSKFMGGPPFSGFALLPPGLAAAAAPLPAGMANVFRRAEIPREWPGREICEDSGNPGLALRLAASLFELARFQRLDIGRVARVVASFTAATDELVRKLGIRKVAAAPTTDAALQADHPIEMLTLVTLDLCHEGSGILKRSVTFEDAATIHRALIDLDVRLGQPVRCVRLPEGSWGATLRIGLSMPQIVRLDALDDAELAARLAQAMDRIAEGLAPLLGD